MSVNAEVYLIVGLDIEPFVTDKFEDWRWTEEAEKFTDYCREGEVQFIEDEMCGMYTYFGYIVSNIEEDEMYGYYKEEVLDNKQEIENEVHQKLKELVDMGILKDYVLKIKLKTIIFTRCS